LRNTPGTLARYFAVGALVGAGFILGACSDDPDDGGPAASPPAAVATQAPEGTSAPAATGTTAAAAPAEPDGARIFEDVKKLSDEIGPRPAGTPKENAAADFIADRFRSLGYDVSFQEFSIATQTNRFSAVKLTGGTQEQLSTYPFDGSSAGTVTARIVPSGIGRPSEFPPEVAGNIALMERGELLFAEKVANAIAAGARGVIIYNNDPGIFLGQLGSGVAIPVVSISQEEGKKLVAAPGEAELSVGNMTTDRSKNVIAMPPGQECETVTGGHYDSVPQAPGASDNATGTATVLEIASVLSKNGQAAGHCFVLFGAEELGLLGSRYYVSQLDGAAKSRIKAMLNFDMVGVGDEGWWLIGSSQLQRQMGEIAGELQIPDVEPSVLIRGLSSDHASFVEAGIPALMFHRWEDNLLHTPQDVSNRVKTEYLEEAAQMGVAMLREIASGS
jgi:aminopeptidase YwaD